MTVALASTSSVGEIRLVIGQAPSTAPSTTKLRTHLRRLILDSPSPGTATYFHQASNMSSSTLTYIATYGKTRRRVCHLPSELTRSSQLLRDAASNLLLSSLTLNRASTVFGIATTDVVQGTTIRTQESTAQRLNLKSQYKRKDRSGGYVYKCDLLTPGTDETCNLTLFNNYNLARHKRTVHNRERVACSVCGKSLNRKDALLMHMRMLHSNQVLNHRAPLTVEPTRQSDTNHLAAGGVLADARGRTLRPKRGFSWAGLRA